MKKPEYIKLRKEIQRKCADDLAALDRVWSMMHPDESVGDALLAEEESKKSDDFKGLLKEAVQEALLTIKTETFSTQDVVNAIKELFPQISAHPASVSKTLKRLVDHQIDLVETGRGGEPSKFKRRINPAA